MKKEKVKKTKVKKHRHKWEEDYSDCPFCGGGAFLQCECGDTKEK